MELLATTALTALVSSLVGSLVGALVSKVKTVRIQAEEADAEAEELKAMIAQNTVLTCRMAIYDEHFSIDEKIEAYKIYRDELVGGDVDEYLEKHGL